MKNGQMRGATEFREEACLLARRTNEPTKQRSRWPFYEPASRHRRHRVT